MIRASPSRLYSSIRFLSARSQFLHTLSCIIISLLCAPSSLIIFCTHTSHTGINMVKFVPRVHFLSHHINCTSCKTQLCLKCFPVGIKNGKFVSEIFGPVEDSIVNNLGFYNMECLKCRFTKKPRVYFCREKYVDCKNHHLKCTSSAYQRSYL